MVYEDDTTNSLLLIQLFLLLSAILVLFLAFLAVIKKLRTRNKEKILETGLGGCVLEVFLTCINKAGGKL